MEDMEKIADAAAAAMPSPEEIQNALPDTAAKSLGQIAFEAYNESKGGLTYDGKPIPPWSSLSGETGESVKAAWEAAIGAAIAEDIARCAPSRLITIAREKMQPSRTREASLAITKLDEASMWWARVPVQAP